ncbi:protein SMG5 [Coccinella septempunctata]|uniref:protein SMG5 n=1 Tax=Coccinella septempunctata TaxID=41139 RepID=UPI001D077094|nr:protein SMG5 [Coccinella septempunctata]
MKKRFSSADINQKHGNELSKKLYRTITDQTKRLDDARSCARSICDLFTPNLLIQRRKLCEYCERLIFSDPALYGRKGEELLWRKVFYDTVSAAKKLKKNVYTQDEISYLHNHIYAGIGFYHHLISKLQTTYNLSLPNVIDFPISENETVQNGELKEYHQEWAELAVHQCLIYLGDLNRYKLEITPSSNTTLPIRFYMQAISYKPDYGMPHNQMGTLALSQENHLDAVYHYMRCMACKYPFDGTSNNLISLFEKNSHYLEQLPQQHNDADCAVLLPKGEQVKRFIARFLLLIDIWYFNKNIPKVFNLCHLTFKDLDNCLSYSKPSSESGETPTDADSLDSENSNSPTYLNSRILFKITVICLLCISKLQSGNSQQVSTVTAFTLAVYSQLVQKITNHIQVSVLNYPLAEVDVKKQKKKHFGKKLRRRRKLKKDLNEDSESSDDDISMCSSDGSFISDQEDILVESSEDELDVTLDTTTSEGADKTIENHEETDKALTDSQQKEEVLKKVKKMDMNDMIEIISEENLLQSIKILNDWLMLDTAILKSCCTNTRCLIRQITYLLNLVNLEITEKQLKHVGVDLTNVDKVNEEIPLTEDVVLKGWDFLSGSQKKLDWKRLSKKTFTVKEEAMIRIIKLKAFGKHLMSISEAGITFDEKEKVYVCKADDKEKKTGEDELNTQDFSETPETPPLINGKTREASTPSPNNSRGGQLIKMKHMGQLWLASEVSALENRVRGKTSLSPYLVIDADALTKYNFMVKYLVQSRKFIVLVPTAVVSALDDLKREKPEARDAIRWLETQFQRGNRFFRSQRPQERASIPLIKYPKKKDKEMFNYIQIIECCYYLSEQQKGATNVVTLLIGNQNLLTNGENKEFSYVGLAKTAGITIESITQFYNKWKKTSRDNR